MGGNLPPILSLTMRIAAWASPRALSAIEGFLPDEQNEITRAELVGLHFGGSERRQAIRLDLRRREIPDRTTVPDDCYHRIRHRRHGAVVQRLRKDMLNTHQLRR